MVKNLWNSIDKIQVEEESKVDLLENKTEI